MYFVPDEVWSVDHQVHHEEEEPQWKGESIKITFPSPFPREEVLPYCEASHAVRTRQVPWQFQLRKIAWKGRLKFPLPARHDPEQNGALQYLGMLVSWLHVWLYVGNPNLTCAVWTISFSPELTEIAGRLSLNTSYGSSLPLLLAIPKAVALRRNFAQNVMCDSHSGQLFCISLGLRVTQQYFLKMKSSWNAPACSITSESDGD